MNDDSTLNDSELSIRDAFLYLLANWKQITIINVSGWLLLVVYSLSLSNIYSSTSMLGIADSGSSGGGALSNLADQYGGVAKAVGLNLSGGNGSNKIALSVATLSSRTFFEKHLYEKINVDLMAVVGWNSTNNTLIYDSKTYDIQSESWKVDEVTGKTFKPSTQKSYESFQSLLNINDETRHSGFLHITTEHYSPYIAQSWNSLLINSINEEVRAQDIEVAQNAVNFLIEQMKSTSLASLETLFADLIEEQTKTIMLAKVARNYVFQLVEKPFVAERKSKPNRARICVIGAILVFVFSVLSILVMAFVKKEKIFFAKDGF